MKTCNNSIHNFGRSNYNSCPRCGSTSFQSGAGLKPGQESRKCSDCGEFLGYFAFERPKRPKKRFKPGLEPISAILARLEIGGEG